MTLKCTSFEQMEKAILQRNASIVVFGAGVLGTITTPEVLNQYNLHGKLVNKQQLDSIFTIR